MCTIMGRRQLMVLKLDMMWGSSGVGVNLVEWTYGLVVLEIINILYILNSTNVRLLWYVFYDMLEEKRCMYNYT